jgi:hypothetical protein
LCASSKNWQHLFYQFVKDQHLTLPKLHIPFHTCCGFALAIVFFVLGTSLYIPIAEALWDDSSTVVQKSYYYSAEAEETLEENEESIAGIDGSLKAAIRRHFIAIHQTQQARHLVSIQMSKARAFETQPRPLSDLLLITGRIHSTLPG